MTKIFWIESWYSAEDNKGYFTLILKEYFYYLEAKLINTEIIDGASSGEGKTENHLTMIRITIYPNVQRKNNNSGMKTNKNLVQSPK